MLCQKWSCGQIEARLANTPSTEAFAETIFSANSCWGIEVRSDIYNKPVQQLGALLGLVEVKLERVQTQKDQKRKIYRYRIAPESWERIQGIVERRKVIREEEFELKQYGWSETEGNEDVS